MNILGNFRTNTAPKIRKYPRNPTEESQPIATYDVDISISGDDNTSEIAYEETRKTEIDSIKPIARNDFFTLYM